MGEVTRKSREQELFRTEQTRQATELLGRLQTGVEPDRCVVAGWYEDVACRGIAESLDAPRAQRDLAERLGIAVLGH